METGLYVVSLGCVVALLLLWQSIMGGDLQICLGSAVMSFLAGVAEYPAEAAEGRRGLFWLVFGGNNLSWQGRHGGRSMRQLVTVNPWPGSRERGMLVLSSLSPSYLVREPSPCC